MGGWAISPDGNWVYAANHTADSVSVINTGSGQVEAEIPVGRGPATRVEPVLAIYFARDGRAIGIEITVPDKPSSAAFNRVLRELGFRSLKRADLAPPIAA